jgi:hypothetical protein
MRWLLRSLASAVALTAAVGTADAVTISFQNGVDGYTGADNESFTFDGLLSADVIRVDLPNMAQPAGSYAWIQFSDIIGPGAIPSGSVVSSAMLEGFVDNPFGSATAGRLLDDIANRPDDFGAAAGSFYEDDAGQLVSASHAACVSTSLCDPPVPIAWDVTALVQAWVDGGTNFGFVLIPETTNGGNVIGTDDTINTTLRARLVVSFVPEPGALALLALAAGLTLRGSRRAA